MARVAITSSLLAVAVLHEFRSASAFTDSGPPFDRCDTKEAYYSDLLAQSGTPSQWNPIEVSNLITTSHRNVLDNVAQTQNGDDIVLALKELWKENDASANNNNFNIRVIYRDIPFPSNLANTQLGWEREDLWPRGRGWDFPANQEIWTDVHGKAPADSTVLEKKDDLFFGLCGTVEDSSKCFSPATSETAVTTEQDAKIFAPPDQFKGDVARALFYTAARYKASLNLTLTDCPPFAENEFGYLSELIRWHEQDPVSDAEMERNRRACVRWQGNRNPFVDYPELVNVFYPQGADEVIPNAFKYSRCTEPTEAPTSPRVACNDLDAGDIPVFLLNSDDPDQVVFFPLVDIPGSVGTLYLTDSAWDGTRLLDNEGTYQFEIPTEGIQAGVVFGFGDNSPMADKWTQLENLGNQFDLQGTGDQLFLYCLDLDNLPNFITGMSFNGPWLEGGLTVEDYGTGKSALPPALELGGSMVLEHFDNCVYVGPLDGIPKAQLEAFMIDPRNFDCVDEPRIQLDVSSSASLSSTLTWACSLVVGVLTSSLVLLA